MLKSGASGDDIQRFSLFVRRMQGALFFDSQARPLHPRGRVIEQYRKDGLVLFLGAGVSRGSGIPNWKELAETILLKSGIIHVLTTRS
jgi:hypothetical protein